MPTREHLVTVTITTSYDPRVHRHLSYFVDVRDGGPHGRQMTTRNPGTHAEALAFVDELKAAAKRQPKAIRFDVRDQVPARYR